ncbi:MAG TPA: OmpA family protein [Patescibacteria group bacterium]|nr:OmpA family protein [Patescibacteria group bacterium]
MRLSTFFKTFLASVILSGCVTFSGDEYKPDTTPPPGYNPIYLNTIKQVDNTNLRQAALQITRIDLRDPQKVKLYVQLSDSNGAYLRGANETAFKKMWCSLSEEIAGITRNVSNFTIRETTELDRVPLALAVVMDHSGSMGDDRARAVQNAVEEFIKLKKPEDQLALVKYDHRTIAESPLSGDQSELLTRLKKDGLMSLGGGTAIIDGIAAGIDQLQNAPNNLLKAIVVFTDGHENSSKQNKDSVIARARKSGILVCAVDFGAYVNAGFMQEFADRTSGSYHHMYGTGEFKFVFEDIYRRLKNSYVIEYKPVDYGLHNVRLKACLPQDSLIAIASYDNTPNIGDIALLNVFFDFNKSTITAESKNSIDNVYALLKAFPTMKIELRGHTDSQNKTGDADYNTKLSQKRAEAVKEALVKRGIAADRISAFGYGESRPVADNATEEGRALNRRTEFVIISR